MLLLYLRDLVCLGLSNLSVKTWWPSKATVLLISISYCSSTLSSYSKLFGLHHLVSSVSLSRTPSGRPLVPIAFWTRTPIPTCLQRWRRPPAHPKGDDPGTPWRIPLYVRVTQSIRVYKQDYGPLHLSTY